MRTALVIFPLLLLILVMTSVNVSAQTDTPTPEPTSEPTVTLEPPYRYEVIDDQTVRYDYIITAGDLMIGGLMLVQVVSVWLIAAIFYLGGQQRG